MEANAAGEETIAELPADPLLLLPLPAEEGTAVETREEQADKVDKEDTAMTPAVATAVETPVERVMDTAVEETIA